MIHLFMTGFDVMTLLVFLWTLYQEWRIRGLLKTTINDDKINKLDSMVTKIKQDIQNGSDTNTTTTTITTGSQASQ